MDEVGKKAVPGVFGKVRPESVSFRQAVLNNTVVFRLL